MKALAVAMTCGLAILSASPSLAFEVNPLVHLLKPSQEVRDTSLAIKNTSSEELRIEVDVFELRLGGDGLSRGMVADDRLFALPPAAVISPGAERQVRVRWLDAAPLERDESFIVAIRQVANDTTSPLPESGVQMLLTFNAIVHVESAGSKPALIAEDLEFTDDERLRFTLVNAGWGNAYGERMRFSLDNGERYVPIERELLVVEGAHLFLPPGESRDVEVSVPEGDWGPPAEVVVDYVER